MVFTSVAFLFFFLPLALLVHLLPLGLRWKNFYLLILSLLFYTYGEGKNLLLMVSAIVIAYGAGRMMGSFPNHKKKVLGISVGLLLMQLFVFKYLGFVSRIFSNLLSIQPVDILMPIGISFFTFQAISYVVDVYRGEKPVETWSDVALYISLFPQLVAGPIVRYGTISFDLRHRRCSLSQFTHGLDRFLLGFSMKMLLANAMGQIADRAFALNITGSLTAPMALLGIVSYTLQIYYDFNAYSHMAIGMGHMFGFTFPENFNYPYVAKSITEFWRRWHMSLSSYFRDYVYIPLGGNRCSLSRHIFNLFVVWFLTGLWHGAGYNFIAWGLYYFLLLVIEKYIFKKESISHIYTMVLVMMGWILFRAESLHLALDYFRSFGNWSAATGHTFLYDMKYFSMELILGLLSITPHLRNWIKKRLPWLLRPLLFVLFLLAVLKLFTEGFNPFIYFRF